MPKMLVTRPEPDAEETIARLAALGIAGISVPLLERAALHTSLPEPKGFAALALTSANALRALAERDRLAPFLGLKVYAVGERTAAAARAHGFAEVVSAGGTMQHLVEDLGAAGLAGPVFYPAARHQSGDLAKALAPFGVMVVTSRVYEMRTIAMLPEGLVQEIRGNQFAGALFYSRRSAETFVSLAGQIETEARARLAVLCLSEQVAAPLIAARFVRVGLADHPSEEAMMALALSFARDRNTP